MNGNGRNMYVFRDGRRSVTGPSLVEALAARVQKLAQTSPLDAGSRNLIIDVLLGAGELECALADTGSPEAGRVAALTDIAASLLTETMDGCPSFAPRFSALTWEQDLLALLPQHPPATLHLSPPEGFAYYALHPLDFADLALQASVPRGRALVVGIRSIGVMLSAVARAALLKRGIHAERLTVRPIGHPYDRRTEFNFRQLEQIANARAHESEFLVVDEGPGMSGSSFLSVGEALLSAGVARSRVQFLCSRQPDVSALCARDAARRWDSFRVLCAAPATHLPAGARIYIGGGYWRHELIGHDPRQWPASWSQMERLKFLSPDRRTLFKFEGFGRFGAAVHQRAQVLAEAGYATLPLGSLEGFGMYPFAEGSPMRPADLAPDVVQLMAGYCAFRVRAFRCDGIAGAPHLSDVGRCGSSHDNVAQLETMLRFNLAEEFDFHLNGDLGSLAAANPVIVDGRMLPHEWIRARDDRLLKADATSHGDDHFFPGPATDICWDLAGAIVEWEMPPGAVKAFLAHYRSTSGDDPRSRLPAYLLAYTVFRMAYCKMAASAMAGSNEEPRLLAAYRYYRQRVAAFLPEFAPQSSPDNSLLAAD
ncbi:MAG: hypothetical protein ACE14L_02395 [Terriglobales bacterium]